MYRLLPKSVRQNGERSFGMVESCEALCHYPGHLVWDAMLILNDGTTQADKS